MAAVRLCCDNLCGDLQIPLRNELLQLRVLLLEMSEPFYVRGLELAEPLTPLVDRLVADPVLLGHFGDWCRVGLPQDLYHLLFGESGLLHGFLLCPSPDFSPRISV